eukprot:7866788-Pyramimonas_sp.AAC.1
MNANTTNTNNDETKKCQSQITKTGQRARRRHNGNYINITCRRTAHIGRVGAGPPSPGAQMWGLIA